MQDSQFKDRLLNQSDVLFRLAYRMLRNTEDAQDALSDVTVKAWSKREQLQTYDRLEAVLYQMTRNHCIDLIRKRRETVPLEAVPLGDETEHHHHSTSDRIELIIATLPELQQEVLHLRMVEGLTMRQIAELKDLKVNTVEVNLSRARKKIRDLYHERYPSH